MATAPPRKMRGAQTQKGRWDRKIHGSYLQKLFAEKKAPYKVIDKSIALKVRDEHPDIFGNFLDTNFWNNYRSSATDYILKLAQPSRDAESSYPSGSDDEEMGLGSDLEYEDEDEEEDIAGGGSPERGGRCHLMYQRVACEIYRVARLLPGATRQQLLVS